MIGRAFRDDRRRGALALAIGVLPAALQYQGALLERSWADRQGGTHLVVALGVTVVLWRLAGRDFDTLGLRMRVEPTWRFWWRAAGAIALAVGVVCAAFLVTTGKYEHLSFHMPDADTWLARIPDACIFSPVFEELVYRLALCSTLVALIGRWPTVIASGAVFGLVHIAYDIGGPDNFVAGYFFAWVYLRSGSIVLPIAMHAGGNLIVVLLRPTF